MLRTNEAGILCLLTMANRNCLPHVLHATYLLFFDEDDEDDDYLVTTSLNDNYAEEIVPNMSCRQFKSHFRVDPTTFEILYGGLARISPRRVGKGRPELSLNKQLMITIWVLANQESFRSVADRFGVARSAAWRAVYRTCNLILALNRQTGIVKWPSREKVQRTSVYIQEKTNMPGVLGFIDGSHIPINKPNDSPASYINRKGIPSLQLQCVCDHRMMFIDCYTGEAGSTHDLCLFRRSPLYEDIENDVAKFPNDSHLLGDPAYTLTLKLMKCYRNNGFLTDTQKNFNYTLSSARVIIERAFGFLKGRLRRLKHLENTRLDLAVLLIISACILHNICILQGDEAEVDVDEEVNQERLLNEMVEPLHNEQLRPAEAKRNRIANAIPMRLRH